ncbi:hypothetical protein, partial [Burkholderia vietnamiensis]|uniref:hypothetical protein n=1 Tax=Burkholderia vietnamiensis TaxID=60552 RepID=UPI001E3A72C9
VGDEVLADELGYGQCLTRYLGQTKSRVAVDSIYDACDKLHRGDSMLFNGKGRYYQCVASNLRGVGRDYSVAKIKEICLDKGLTEH